MAVTTQLIFEAVVNKLSARNAVNSSILVVANSQSGELLATPPQRCFSVMATT